MKPMPIRYQTHPLVHFLEFYHNPASLSNIPLYIFKKKLKAHVDAYAVDASVRNRFKTTPWNGAFYGWVFQVYKLRIVEGARGTHVVKKVY